MKNLLKKVRVPPFMMRARPKESKRIVVTPLPDYYRNQSLLEKNPWFQAKPSFQIGDLIKGPMSPTKIEEVALVVECQTHESHDSYVNTNITYDLVVMIPKTLQTRKWFRVPAYHFELVQRPNT